MKLIIAGSRDINIDNDELFEIIDKFGILYKIREVVSGSATGVDSSGQAFAEQYNIRLTMFPADWSRYGGLAGPRRNLEMAEYSDALLLIWDGKSRGSANMKARMKGMGKPIFEVIKVEQ
jgi:YspA, cpYpsA-related SLOG family